MEKRKPHFPLEGGSELGLDVAGMLAVVNGLTPRDFFKSMTAYADHQVWQDVYLPHTNVGQVYLKLTLTADVLILSFKEK